MGQTTILFFFVRSKARFLCFLKGVTAYISQKQGSRSARVFRHIVPSTITPRNHYISHMLLLLPSPPQRKQLEQRFVCIVNRDPVVVTGKARMKSNMHSVHETRHVTGKLWGSPRNRFRPSHKKLLPGAQTNSPLAVEHWILTGFN